MHAIRVTFVPHYQVIWVMVVMSHLNKVLEVYDKRASAFYSLREQGKEAKAYLKKHGFTGARALVAVGSRVK